MFRDIIYICVIIGLLLFSVKECNQSIDYKNDVAKLSSYKDTAMFYESKSKTLVTYNTALEISKEALIKSNKDLQKELDDLKLKDPKVITRIKTVTIIDSIPITFETKLPCDTFIVNFSHKEDWFSLDGTITDKNINLRNLILPNDFSIITAKKKNGLFKKNELVVTVVATNPYVQTTGLQNYVITEKKPWYNQLWFKVLTHSAAFAVGTQIK